MTAGGNDKEPSSLTTGNESAENRLARRKKALDERVTALARWRVAARKADCGGGEPQEAKAAGPGRTGGGKGAREDDRERRKTAVKAKITALARLREDAYYCRNVSGEGAKTRLVIDGDDREGFLLETFIRLEAGQSSNDLPPSYASLIACDGDFKKRQWFNELLRMVPNISIVVRVLRFVMKGRTLVLVSWGFGEKKDPSQVPRFFDTAGDHVEDCCGYWGELKDFRGRKLREVVHGWFPHTDSDRLAWFGDGEDAGKKRPAPAPAEVPTGLPADRPATRERKKRKEVPISGAALLCSVSERTIKNWEAGKGTPAGWPGRNNLQDLRHFGAKRGSIKAFAKASRIGLGAVRHTGRIDRAADDPDED